MRGQGRRIAFKQEDPGKAPDWVLFFPVGLNSVEPPARSYYVTHDSFLAIQALMRRYGSGFKFPGNYDHKEGDAPFWIVEWKWVDGEGIWGKVEWTADGRENVEKKNRLYISPDIWIKKAGDKWVLSGLRGPMALVSFPATHNQEPLVLSMSGQFEEIGDDSMDLLKELAKLLGLDPETATVEQMMEKIKPLLAPPEDKEAAEKAMEEELAKKEQACALSVQKALGLSTAFGRMDQVLPLIKAKQGEASAMDQLRAEVAELRQAQKLSAGKELYAQHEDRLTPAERKETLDGKLFWQSLAVEQPEVFKAALGQRMSAVSSPLPPKKTSAEEYVPTPGELHIAKLMGNDLAQLKKYGKTVEG